MSIKVSVIVPVYNAEKYVASCIESLLNQTLQECEFIFVNDGSKDQSGQVIEEYRKKDSRIKLIQQTNQGVSAARNAGLQAAAGAFVGFVDADDYVDKDMYEVLYSTAVQGDYDVVISNFESEIEGHKVITTYPFPHGTVLKKDYIEQEVLTYFLKSDQLNTVCSKLYKHKQIRDYQVKFPDKVALGEDGLFNMQFFRHADRIRYIDYTGYHYREVIGSATRNILEKDYFKRALEVYTLDIPDMYLTTMDKMRIQQLRSVKLINSVMSYIYVYFKASTEISLGERFKYVRNMINDPYVREALPYFYSEMYPSLGTYEKFIADMINKRFTLGLFAAATYSRLRNKA
ncbi:glycosyltransferase [Paenibacillus sp. OAS669]|uniref:glycosyltransferase n=1 Tax=Paenibacillus sp. OAS669 TaxID=2663821 RepID=UPI00178AB803|nr:glycosyltransferase [Paenibacillus sp. OAS669]MBE1444718.1 glycosyltransferase involved in cell wall biosynthesis [Paenibacillus sp. OAS669]